MSAPLFRRALGADWERLAPEVRALHDVEDVRRWSGRCEIERGRGLLRLAGWLAGFPPAGTDVPVTVTMARQDGGEVWMRDFGRHRFRSVCGPSTRPGHSRETVRGVCAEMALRVERGRLHLALVGAWWLGVPLPRMVRPVSEAMEWGAAGRYRFDVSVGAPFGLGCLVRYRGWLEPDPASPA